MPLAPTRGVYLTDYACTIFPDGTADCPGRETVEQFLALYFEPGVVYEFVAWGFWYRDPSEHCHWINADAVVAGNSGDVVCTP